MNRAVVALMAVAVVVGAIYVWRVPAGLPYDEPSHWSTVVYYADHGRMPVLGDRGVTYEAQQAPLAYVVDAVAVRVVRTIGGSEKSAFYIARLLGVLELAAVVAVVFLITRRAAATVVTVGATLLVAANPMLLTMSASVQNDTLALALGCGALLLSLIWLAPTPAPGKAALVGALVGLAILAKLTAWVLVPAIGGWLIYRYRRRATAALIAFGIAGALISGWWFVRNEILYGDLTASKAVSRTGVYFPRGHLRGPGDVTHLVESAVTYLWLPTEYLRNTISADALVKGAVVALTVFLIAAGLVRRRRVRFEGLVVVVAVLALATWLVLYYTDQALSPRFAYQAFPIWIVLCAAAGTSLRARTVVPAAALVLIALNIWTLTEVRHAPRPPSPVASEHKELNLGGHLPTANGLLKDAAIRDVTAGNPPPANPRRIVTFANEP